MNTATGETRGRRIVKERFIEPYFNREARYVGVEFEYPVIKLCDGDTRAASSSLLELLTNRHGFGVVSRGTDGLLTRVKAPEGDCISFELNYGILEFSMWRDVSLTNLSKRFNRLLKIAAEHFAPTHAITGMGTNLKMDFDNIPYLEDNLTHCLTGFMKNHTYYRKAGCLFNNMFSAQSHVEVPGERLLDAFNLMFKLSFVRGILFSNSLPHPQTLPPGKTYPDDVLCARDYNWKYSDFPALGCYDREFKTIDELAGFISGLEFFLDKKDGVRIPADKISINRYFENPENPDENFQLFRMLSHVALNHYHTLEIRDDCVQPVSDAFAPAALNLGILSNLDEAIEAVTGFLGTYGNGLSNSELRAMAVTGQKIADDELMVRFLRRLYGVAYQGLVRRGYGEERFLRCLQQRIERLSCPAKDMLEELARGVTLEEMERRYGP